MTEEQRALIRYRLSQAYESLKEADVLHREGMSFRSVVNRLYYAMFYAILGLLQENQVGTSKHSGAISYFDRAYIKTGIFDRKFSKMVHRALEVRQKGDYLEQAEVTVEDIEELRPAAQEFLKLVENYLMKKK